MRIPRDQARSRYPCGGSWARGKSTRKGRCRAGPCMSRLPVVTTLHRVASGGWRQEAGIRRHSVRVVWASVTAVWALGVFSRGMAAVNRDMIIAAVGLKPDAVPDRDITSVPSDLDKAFSMQHVLVTPENVATWTAAWAAADRASFLRRRRRATTLSVLTIVAYAVGSILCLLGCTLWLQRRRKQRGDRSP